MGTAHTKDRSTGGKIRVDKVGRSGVYPVSEMKNASPQAKVRGEKSFGQGKRGAAGYEDAGGSGIFLLDEELEAQAKKKSRKTGRVK